MVQIKAFHGLRYNDAAIQSQFDAVTAPPYDVISNEGQQRLYEQHPNNIVRLILGKKDSSDTETHNVYTRASETLQHWLESHTMQLDNTPAIYAYSQTWPDLQDNGTTVETTRMGFVARLRLSAFDQRQVLPHEETLSGPKVDRLNLTRATRTTLSPIFCLYNDPSHLVETQLFASTPQDAITVTDPDGVLHRFWPVTDTTQIAAIEAMMTDKSALIADGHHRYETALAYQAECGDGQGNKASDYTMSFFCNTQSPGLRVYPTHRILKQLPNGLSPESFLDAFHNCFEVATSDEQALLWLQRDANGSKTPYQLKPSVSLATIHPAMQTLDVAILDALVFEGILKTPANQLKQDGDLLFIRDDAGVAEALADGALVAFWMHAPDVHLVEQICQQGLRMPQKSTYFYPKLLSGLVAYPHFEKN